MAGFLYFAKGWRQPVTRRLAEEWGLGYALENEPVDAECNHPELGRGRLFTDLKRQDARALIARGRPRQVWSLHSPATGDTRPEVHVGYWSDAAPQPCDLLRSTALPGHEVELGDGLSWVAPVALQWDAGLSAHTAALPRGAVYDPVAAQWGPGKVDPRYEPLWEIATRFDEWMRRENQRGREALGEQLGPAEELEVTLSKAEALTDATAALGFNYLVGPVEASVLGWFARDSQVALRVLEAVVDWPSLLAMVKKKEATATGGG